MNEPECYYLPEKSESVDFLLITGDAYIDHPSFGSAVISRVLYDAGYSVCIVSQPDYNDRKVLDYLPNVKLCIGITSGNLDSVVSNYSGNRNRRKEDSYSVDGIATFPEGHQKRPDRALIPYTSFIKQRYKNIPVVIGGIEASLRRFSHYDYVQDKIRDSILIDSKADILVYGMGESAILNILKNIKNGEPIIGIDGTASVISANAVLNREYTTLPSITDIKNDPFQLIKLTEIIESNMTHQFAKNLIQYSGNRAIISHRPQKLLTEQELDRVYSLPYRRTYPNYYNKVPAYRMIENSITSHRGCYGRCSFCAITSHQGPLIASRSKASLIEEAKTIVTNESFKGTISDVGGPTANMYASYCRIGGCKEPSCLYPTICKELVMDHKSYSEALKEISKVKGVAHLFISSGLRYDMLLEDQEAAEYLIVNHTSGLLKIAPEHTADSVLSLMRKPSFSVLKQFLELFKQIKKKNKLPYHILPYIILSHPGSTLQSVNELAVSLKKYGISTKQYQDFTPTPGTMSTAMFYAAKSPNGKDIPIQRFSSLNNPQRKRIEELMKRN